MMKRNPPRSASPGDRNYPHPRQTFPQGKFSAMVNASRRSDSFDRKRAKTDDEKEQRRIERVLRNRQAAQSSRERKRQEVEKLEGEKAAIEEQNQQLKERLMAVEHEKFLLAQKVAKMTAQMRTLRDGSATPTPEPSSPTFDGFDHAKIKQELDNEYSFLPTPSTSFDHASSSFASPSTMTYSPSQSPHSVGLGLDEDSLTSSADVTQHPAAMLCDLPCPSAEALCQASPTRPLILPTAQIAIPSSTANLLCLILTSAIYSQLMVPLRTILTSSKMDSALLMPPSKGTLSPLIRSSTLTQEITLR